MSTRAFFGKFFGEENVLWAAGEGPEPADQELEARCRDIEARRLARSLCRRAELREQLAMIERVIAAPPGETGLQETELQQLPALHNKLLLLLSFEEASRERRPVVTCWRCGAESGLRQVERDETCLHECDVCHKEVNNAQR